MRFLLFLSIVTPFCVNAQTEMSGGIHFEQGLSWIQLKHKAKAEHKFIFVDCYATWCSPCKVMDNKVYSNDTVGAYMNDKFISVKVQLDTSKKDDFEVQSWYTDAHDLKAMYKVSALPTYLFFSPDGNAVHRETAYKPVREFIKIASDAITPQRQFYTLLK